MLKKSRHSTTVKSAVLALACLGLFFVAGINQVGVAKASTVIPGSTLAISDEYGGTSAAVTPVTPVVVPTTPPASQLAISAEFGGNTAPTTAANHEGSFTTGGSGSGSSTEGHFTTGNTTSHGGEQTFITGGETATTSVEQSFTTNSGGGNGSSTDEHSFTTLSPTSTPAEGEHSFSTLPTSGGGCVSNCGGGGGGSSGGGSSGGSGFTSGGGGYVLGASTALPPPPCPVFLREYIHIGRPNNPVEVRKLQAFLNVFEGEHLAITGFYGPADFAAVERFQTKYLHDVLGPWGISAPTGYVFITTRLAINNIYCHRSTANDLNLRHYYPEIYQTIARAKTHGEIGTAAATSSLGSAALATRPNIFQTAAASLFNLFHFTPGRTLIALLTLAILFMLFLIWRLSKYPDTTAPHENTFSPEDEVLIDDDEVSSLDLADDDPTQPPLDPVARE